MLAWLRRLPEDKWDRGFIRSLAAQLAKHSPDEALAWANSIKNPAQTAAALTGVVVDTLATVQPERVLSLLAALPPEAAQDFIRGVFQRNIDWGDFLKFSKAMDSLTDPGDRAAAMEGAMPRLLLQQ